MGSARTSLPQPRFSGQEGCLDNDNRFSTICFFLAILALFAGAANAWAYLDPGSGSYLLQILIAVLLGGAFTLKTYWGRFIAGAKRLFGRKQEKKERDDDKSVVS